MAKILALITSTVALVAGVQAQCAANVVRCGSDLVNSGCTTRAALQDFLPDDNTTSNPLNCVFNTNGSGQITGIAYCCTTGPTQCVNANCVPI